MLRRILTIILGQQLIARMLGPRITLALLGRRTTGK